MMTGQTHTPPYPALYRLDPSQLLAVARTFRFRERSLLLSKAAEVIAAINAALILLREQTRARTSSKGGGLSDLPKDYLSLRLSGWHQ